MEVRRQFVQILSVTDLDGELKNEHPYNGLLNFYAYIPQICADTPMIIMHPNEIEIRLTTTQVKAYSYDATAQIHTIRTMNSIYTMQDYFNAAARKRAKATLYMTSPIGRRYREANPDPEGHLLAYGKYRTKIFPRDLPEWYVGGYMYKRHGYISAKGVKYLHYKPNYLFNHMYKDDILLISYDGPITPTRTDDGFEWFEGYEHQLSGLVILDFVKAAARYSGIDTGEIEAELKRKRDWYEKTYK